MKRFGSFRAKDSELWRTNCSDLHALQYELATNLQTFQSKYPVIWDYFVQKDEPPLLDEDFQLPKQIHQDTKDLIDLIVKSEANLESIEQQFGKPKIRDAKHDSYSPRNV